MIVTAYLSERILEFVYRKQAEGVRLRVILLGEPQAGLDVSGCDLLQLVPLELEKEAAV